MPRRISRPSLVTAICSRTLRLPSASIQMSLVKLRITSAALRGAGKSGRRKSAMSRIAVKRRMRLTLCAIFPLRQSVKGDIHRPAHGIRLVIGKLKKLRLRETERTRDEIARELVDLDIIVAHHAVIIAPRRLDIMFDGGELALQIQEIFVGFEL